MLAGTAGPGLAAGPVVADDAKLGRARAHMRAAVAHYDDGHYDEAAHEMEAAYQLQPVAELQYNLAQCYERLNRLDEAAAAYQRYVDDRPTAADLPSVERRIEKLRQRAQAGRTPLAPPPPEKVVFKTIVVYRQAPPPPGRAVRWAAYGAAGIAAGSLAAGISCAVLALKASNEVNVSGNVDTPPSFDGRPRDAQQRGQTLQIVAFVSFGVAALAAAGGVGLYLLGNKIDREAPSNSGRDLSRYHGRSNPTWSLAPTLSPGGGGLWAQGRF